MAEPSLPPPDEVIPSTEGEDLAVITRISQEILDITRRPMRRGQHPKQHGVVRAEFTVEPDVPDDLRPGPGKQHLSSTGALSMSSRGRRKCRVQDLAQRGRQFFDD